MEVEALGDFHIAEENQQKRLQPLVNEGIEELIFLSTCNRVELLFRTQSELTNDYLIQILAKLYPNWDTEKVVAAANKAVIYSHLEAVYHWFRVACSLDSLVIGEREIMGQMRKAYALCKQNQLNGDFMRILMRKTVETAKAVYTETGIANNPVSVVNLAYHKLESLVNPLSCKTLVVGAGKTNQAIVKKMKKHGFSDFTVYNRTLEKAQALADTVEGVALPLHELGNRVHDFDLLITCTGSEDHIINAPLFEKITAGNTQSKVIVDLAVPTDIHPSIPDQYIIDYISVSGLKEIAMKNMEKRKNQLAKCEEIIDDHLADFEHIHKVRQVELAMRKVPEQVKEIKRKAVEEVFVKDLEGLDRDSKAVLDRVLQYMEKKYMSTPMLLAKEILIKEEQK